MKVISVKLTALLVLMSFAPLALSASRYRHKPEAEISRITPAQRVDEWVNEQVHHRYDVLDRHRDILRKYVTRDGLAALPRLIAIMDEYDPTLYREGKGRRGERFDACWLMLGYIDNDAVRLRGSEEGRRAMAALERAIERMRAAGYGQPNQQEWAQHGRFKLAVSYLEDAKGTNLIDRAVGETLRLQYKITLSDEELLAFSNFMVAHYPKYPGWSETQLTTDHMQISAVGIPVRVRTVTNPERFYQAYLEVRGRKP